MYLWPDQTQLPAQSSEDTVLLLLAAPLSVSSRCLPTLLAPLEGALLVLEVATLLFSADVLVVEWVVVVLVFVCFWTLVVLIGGVGGPPTLLPEDFGTAPLEARSVFFGAVGVTFLVEAELGAGTGGSLCLARVWGGLEW